jgi:hypothetical protein
MHKDNARGKKETRGMTIVRSNGDEIWGTPRDYDRSGRAGASTMAARRRYASELNKMATRRTV